MPHVGKPDMKNGWQVVKVLKMEKHPTGTWESPYNSKRDGESCLKIKKQMFRKKIHWQGQRKERPCNPSSSDIYKWVAEHYGPLITEYSS